jgi:hypothetical protein
MSVQWRAPRSPLSLRALADLCRRWRQARKSRQRALLQEARNLTRGSMPGNAA